MSPELSRYMRPRRRLARWARQPFFHVELPRARRITWRRWLPAWVELWPGHTFYFRVGNHLWVTTWGLP